METERTEQLVDQLLKIFEEADGGPEIKTLVGHRHPDDDAWLCLWMAKRFIPKAKDAEIVFVNSGETLPNSKNDPTVLHFDTGNGQYDQHGKNLQDMSSAAILAQKLGFLETKPGMAPLVELANAVDNIKPLPQTSLHFLIEGWPYKFKENGHINWERVQERVFEAFDVVFGQETQRVENRRRLQENSQTTILPNGLKVTAIFWNPGLAEAAFEDGAAVVVWTTTGKLFCTGIQTSRNFPDLILDYIAADIRRAETIKRGLQIGSQNFSRIGQFGPWYLHDSKKLILNGSRSHPLANENEHTKLFPREVVGIVSETLSRIPRETVENWKK